MDAGLKTRYKLAASLKELVRREPLDKITVKQIVEGCGVSRQTFYRCFLDKYDLVNWYFERLVEQSFKEMGVSLTLREGLLNKFNFIKAEQSFFACAFVDHFVLQSAGQRNHARLFLIFFEESFSLFDGGSAHLSFQFFEILVHYFAGFLMADSRLITFQYIFNCLCKVIYSDAFCTHA